MKHLLIFLTALVGVAAHAHDGHGPSGAHWHATDVAGFVIAAVAVAALMWWRGRK